MVRRSRDGREGFARLGRFRETVLHAGLDGEALRRVTVAVEGDLLVSRLQALNDLGLSNNSVLLHLSVTIVDLAHNDLGEVSAAQKRLPDNSVQLSVAREIHNRTYVVAINGLQFFHVALMTSETTLVRVALLASHTANVTHVLRGQKHVRFHSEFSGIRCSAGSARLQNGGQGKLGSRLSLGVSGGLLSLLLPSRDNRSQQTYCGKHEDES
jgi:hypothetical protein